MYLNFKDILMQCNFLLNVSCSYCGRIWKVQTVYLLYNPLLHVYSSWISWSIRCKKKIFSKINSYKFKLIFNWSLTLRPDKVQFIFSLVYFGIYYEQYQYPFTINLVSIEYQLDRKSEWIKSLMQMSVMISLLETHSQLHTSLATTS